MKKNDMIAGGVFAALGIFILTQTYSYPSLEKGHPGPGLFPNLLAILFMAFGGILIYKGRRFAPAEEPESGTLSPPRKLGNAFSVLALIVVFVAAVHYAGFLITSAVLLFLLMKKLGVSLLRSALASIVITLFINVMFSKILRVPLPPG
ncbi:MAG: tripartite tricarboxylate transporter TctB family protein, partial [Deltaproteobacteria bacterium]